VLDYLEGELPAEGFLFGEQMGLADIALATFFVNARYVDFRVDATRWPRTAGFVSRCLAHPAFADRFAWEKAQMSTNPQGRRAALIEAGVPLSETTYALKEPRKGVMEL